MKKRRVAKAHNRQQVRQPKYEITIVSIGGISADPRVKPTPIHASAVARVRLNQRDTSVLATRLSVPCPANLSMINTSSSSTASDVNALSTQAKVMTRPATRLARFWPSESTIMPINGITHAITPFEMANSVDNTDRDSPKSVTYSLTKVERANVWLGPAHAIDWSSVNG